MAKLRGKILLLNRIMMPVRAVLMIAAYLSVSACQTSATQGAESDGKSSAKAGAVISVTSASEKLDQSALEQLLEETVIKGILANGENVSFEFSKFGHTNDLFVKQYDGAGKVVEQDRGSWWIVQSRICRRLQNMFDAKPDCFAVHKATDKFQFVNKQGKVAYLFNVIGARKTSAAQKMGFSAEKVRNIGTALGYSDLCQEKQSNGVGNLIAKDIKQYFTGNSDFESGYRIYSSLKMYDTVAGLTECEKMNQSLERLHEVLGIILGKGPK